MSKPFWRVIASCMMLVACGDEGKPEEGASTPDAATSRDAGGPRDPRDASSSPRADASDDSAVDAGVGTDGGQTTDGGGNVGFDPNLACSPGSYVPASEFAQKSSPNHAKNCFNAKFTAAGAAGVFSTPRSSISIHDIELAVPMTGGAPYATSYEYQFMGEPGVRKLELWGTSGECGENSTATLLVTIAVVPGKNTYCAQMTPDKAYSHLLLVYRLVDDDITEGSTTLRLGGATFCAAGACPVP